MAAESSGSFARRAEDEICCLFCGHYWPPSLTLAPIPLCLGCSQYDLRAARLTSERGYLPPFPSPEQWPLVMAQNRGRRCRECGIENVQHGNASATLGIGGRCASCVVTEALQARHTAPARPATASTSPDASEPETEELPYTLGQWNGIPQHRCNVGNCQWDTLKGEDAYWEHYDVEHRPLIQSSDFRHADAPVQCRFCGRYFPRAAILRSIPLCLYCVKLDRRLTEEAAEQERERHIRITVVDHNVQAVWKRATKDTRACPDCGRPSDNGKPDRQDTTIGIDGRCMRCTANRLRAERDAAVERARILAQVEEQIQEEIQQRQDAIRRDPNGPAALVEALDRQRLMDYVRQHHANEGKWARSPDQPQAAEQAEGDTEVRLLRTWGDHGAGDVVKVRTALADELIADSAATPYPLSVAPPDDIEALRRTISGPAVQYPFGRPPVCSRCGELAKLDDRSGDFYCAPCLRAEYATLREAAARQPDAQARRNGTGQPETNATHPAAQTIDEVHVRTCRLCMELARATITLYNDERNFDERIPTSAAVARKLGRSERTLRSRKQEHERQYGFPPVMPTQAVEWRRWLT